MAEGKWVSYLRVSTGRQGQGGLGIEAQRKAVEDFLNGRLASTPERVNVIHNCHHRTCSPVNTRTPS
jgi:hypothetical protein